jgi:predicted nuclease of predicted toxin-antitoxin system
MKIKLDENLPLGLATVLKHLGHNVHTTAEEGLLGKPDADVWMVTQREERFLITQDLDFSDLRRFAPEAHYGILLVRLHSPDWRNLSERVAKIFRDEEVELWAGCFVVATEHKIRIVRK